MFGDVLGRDAVEYVVEECAVEADAVDIAAFSAFCVWRNEMLVGVVGI